MFIPLKRHLPRNVYGYILLAVIWLFTGFAMGTLILLVPLRVWINFVRENNLTPTTEKTVVIIIMALLVVFSFILSFKLFRWQYLKRKWKIKFVAVFVPAAAAAMALWAFMHPGIINNNEVSENVSSEFTVGPYPSEEKMKQLKKEGYTAVVSLLHPAVVPFEPSLLKDEEATAAKLHFKVIKAPMLPWIGDNAASLKTIRDIVLKGKGKYYFHCYLGKDRVNVVKNLIQQLTGKANTENAESPRTFETQGSFERGEIYKIDSAVYMTPFPTDEEVLSFFLAGNIKTVINLMDSADEEAKPWIEKEKQALQSMHIQYRIITVNENAKDKNIVPVLAAIDSLPKPIVVHHWSTSCPQSVLLRKNYFNKTKFRQVNLATKDEAAY